MLPKYLNLKNFHSFAGSASQSNIIISNLMGRYDKSIQRNIELKAYKDGDSYVFKIKIPSEKNYKYKTNVFYDAIVEFFPINDKDKESKSIREYSIRVFSNSPTFMFNFTYVYGKMNALYKKIPKSLYSEIALKQPAHTTNPHKLISLEKSIFYSLKKIYEETSYSKSKIDKIVIDLTKNDKTFKFPGNVFDDVDSQVDKLKEVSNSESIRLKSAKKKKASNRTIQLKSGNKTLAVDEYKSGTDNRLEQLLASNLKNSKLLYDNEKMKSSISTNKLKSSKLSKK